MAGNVGTPALVARRAPLDVAVLEVSSFQLESTERFRPAVAVVLNVTPDHLDRHHTIEAYVAAKARILANQRAEDWAVLNEADAWYEHFRAAARARVLPFRASGVPARGVGVDAGSLVVRAGDAPAQRFAFDWREPGVHNRENAIAAAAAVFALGAPLERALAALPAFRPLPHRTELVARARGVTWVDDSKATNPGAALRALEGFARPIVWIAGGRAKGLDLGAARRRRARARARGGADRRGRGAARAGPARRTGRAPRGEHRGRRAPRGRARASGRRRAARARLLEPRPVRELRRARRAVSRAAARARGGAARPPR